LGGLETKTTWKSWFQDIIVLGFIYFVFVAVVVNSSVFASGYLTLYLVASAVLLSTGYLLFLRMSIKRAALAIAVVVLAFVFTASGVWIVVTPNWSFKVTTDKTAYAPGENITITVTIENLGYIAHTFKSSITNPVVVMAHCVDNPFPLWWTPIQYNETEFTVAPNQLLRRTFVWSQTWAAGLGGAARAGEIYDLEAFVPTSDDVFMDVMIAENRVFSGWTSINITAT